MKIDSTHIDKIRGSFEKMESRADFLSLLNEAKSLIYGSRAKPFEMSQLTWYINTNLGGQRYYSFQIEKKSGAQRTIHAPVNGLKVLQKALAFILQCVYEPNKAAMGFIRDKSIVDNAKVHSGKKYVYNIDLKDFFPSIDQARVWKCLQLKPFNLQNAKNGIALTAQDNQDLHIEQMRFFNNREKGVIKYHFYGKNVKPGLKKVTLNNGGELVYRIYSTCRRSDDFDAIFYRNELADKVVNINPAHIGEIVVYKKLTDFDYISDVATNLKNEHNLDLPLNLVIGKIIQNTLVSKGEFEKYIENRSTIANMIAAICCTEMEVERKNEAGEWELVKRNVLPQGAPTSPIVTNIVCQKLDFLLSGVAKRFGLSYTRYADDITFSSMHNVYQPGSDFLHELHRIIAEQKFHIKESKTRIQKDGYRKEVTGLLVNDGVNVQQRFIKQLRMWLYYWERYGYYRASDFFVKQYKSDKGHSKKGQPDMANVISGKLEYLKMVKGKENPLYLNLKGRYNALSGIKVIKKSRQEVLSKVIDLLFDKGLDYAMETYKPENE